MDRGELLEKVAASMIFQHWHWFRWHFQHLLNGWPNALADSIIEACLTCEAQIPGHAERTVSMIANVGGREKDKRDWEQLLQVLAELMVVAHILRLGWDASTRFESEPSVEIYGKNPEIVVRNSEITLAVEVKAPALFSHQVNRARNPEQVASRFASREQYQKLLSDPEKVTWPRDNPIKDFLISAEAKFEQFGHEDSFIGALVIVWDDHIYEPLSALLHPSSGLLTQNSFFTDEQGNPVVFGSVGAVVIIRQLHQMVRACRDEPLADGLVDPLQYDIGDGFPPKVLIGHQACDEQLAKLRDIFLASPPDPRMGVEYTPKDLIWWI